MDSRGEAVFGGFRRPPQRSVPGNHSDLIWGDSVAPQHRGGEALRWTVAKRSSSAPARRVSRSARLYAGSMSRSRCSNATSTSARHGGATTIGCACTRPSVFRRCRSWRIREDSRAIRLAIRSSSTWKTTRERSISVPNSGWTSRAAFAPQTIAGKCRRAAASVVRVISSSRAASAACRIARRGRASAISRVRCCTVRSTRTVNASARSACSSSASAIPARRSRWISPSAARLPQYRSAVPSTSFRVTCCVYRSPISHSRTATCRPASPTG